MDQENQIKYPEEVMFQWCTFAIFNLWKKEKQCFNQSSPFNLFSIDFFVLCIATKLGSGRYKC